MAAQHQALTAAVGQFVQASQAVEQAVAGLPPPDAAFQQQMLQALQQMQAQSQAHQQQMQAQLQQMQEQMQQMRADYQGVSNTVARLYNRGLAHNQALQWLRNAQGELPAHVPMSMEAIAEMTLLQVNELLQHYGIEQRETQARMNVSKRRFLLLEHLGALPPQVLQLAAAPADQ